MLMEGILFSNGLEGQALVLFVVNPSMGPLLPGKVDCHHRQSKISRIIGRSALLTDVARHRLARDPAVMAMLMLPVLGRGDKLPFFFCFTHVMALIYVFLSHFEKSSSFGMNINHRAHPHFNVH